jgi:hypothetical protein
MPVAQVDGIIPRAEDVEWVIGYQVFEFEQTQTICLVCWIGSNSSCKQGKVIEKRRITSRYVLSA